MYKKVMFWSWCLLLGVALHAQEWSNPNISFTAINKMVLIDTEGKQSNLDLPGKPLRLFVMLSPECPLCKNYSLVLNRLHHKYKNNMQLYGIVPGTTYSPDTLQQFAADYRIKFPMLIDSELRLTYYLKATITPEVILADSTGAVVYRGAIDDWVLELGKKKPKPQHHYLDDAINQYLSGQTVQVRSTLAKGCLINEF